MMTHKQGGCSTWLFTRQSTSHILTTTYFALCNVACRVNDVIVNGLPKFLTSDPTDQMHALTIKDPNNPYDLNGLDHPRLHLTSKTLTWDPLTTLFEEQETTMTDYSGNIISNAAMRGPSQMLINNELHSLTTIMADMMHDHNFHRVLASHAHVIISSVDASLNGHVRSRKFASIDFKTLMAWGMVSPERAKQTIQLTMQQGVAHASTPILHNDSQLMIGCFTISGSHI